MSRTIDERIVEMQFNNQQFEQNVRTSMGTLEKLKQALNFGKSKDSLNELNSASRRFNMDGVKNAADVISSRFSALEIVGVTALVNIANQAINTGKQMLSSLTIAPISDGFKEYELKIGSVQTILAGTGESLETVNKYLEELNTYSDKTIYSFSDMTSNIGKFTNAGVKLKDAVAAIKGVSNLAAVSGANAQQASHAMYNFSQALSSGSIKLIDWMSIKNATMDTLEFKQTLLDTAVALKTVTKVGDDYVSATTNAQGKTSDAFNATKMFTDSLQSQWLTTDVLVTTLNAYSQDVREMSDEQRKAYHEQLLATGYTEEQAVKLEELGVKAADAATKVRTFSMLMDTLKEAAGSGWAQTWELIFGDFDVATKLWTSLSNSIGDFIGKQADKRNDLLKQWTELYSIDDGGRGKLMRSFARIARRVGEYIEPIKTAWRSVMPEIDVWDLRKITWGFSELTKHMKWNSETYVNLMNTASGFFSVLKLIGYTALSVARHGIPVLKEALDVLCYRLLEITGPIGRSLKDTVDSIIKRGDIDRFIKRITDRLIDFIHVVDEGIGQFREEGFSGFADWFSKIFDLKSFKPEAVINTLKNRLAGALETILNTIGGFFGKPDLYDSFVNGLTFFKASLEALVDAIVNNPIISKISSTVTAPIDAFFKWISSLVGGDGVAKDIEAFSEKKSVFDRFKDALTAIGEGFSSFIDLTKSIKDNTLGGLDTFQKSFKDFISDLSETLSDVDWASIAVLVGQIGYVAVIIEGVVTIAKAVSAAKGLLKTATGTMNAVKGFFGKINGILDNFTVTKTWTSKLKSASHSIFILSTAVFIMAMAFEKISLVPKEKMKDAAAVMAGMIAALVVAEILVSKFGQGITVGAAVGLLAFAVAIKIIADVLYDLTILAKITDRETLGKAYSNLAILIVIVAIMQTVVLAMGVLGRMTKSEVSIPSIIGLIGFVIALKLLVGVMQDINGMTIDPGFFEKLFAAVIALVAIAAATRLAKFSGAAGIILMALSLKLLIGTLNSIADLDLNALLAKWKNFAAVFGILLGICFLASIAGPTAFQAGIGILAIVIAIRLIINVIQLLGSMNPAIAMKAVVPLVLIFFGIRTLMIATTVSGKYAIQAGASMILIAIALNLMVSVVFLLGSMPAEKAIRGVLAMIPLMLAIGLLMLSTIAAGKNAIQGGVAIVLMTGSLMALVYAVWMLSEIPSAKLMKATTVITILIAAMAALMFFSAFTEFSSFSGIIAVAGAIAILAASVAILTVVPADRLDAATGVILKLTGVLGALMIASAFTQNVKLKTIITMTLMIGLLAGMMAGVAILLSKMNVDPSAMSTQFKAISIAVVSIGTVLALLSKLNINPASAVKAGVGFAAFTGIIGVLIGVFVGLNELASIIEQKTGVDIGAKVEKAIETIRTIGKALGSFIGGVLDGIFGGFDIKSVFKDLMMMVTSIGAISASLVATSSTLSGANLEPIKGVIDVIGAFADAKLTDALAGILGKKDLDFGDFGKQISKLAESLVGFSDKLTTAKIDPTVVDQAVGLAKSLAELYGMDELKTGGFIGQILGNSLGLDKLGDQLYELASGLTSFSMIINIEDFNDEKIKAVEQLAKFLATLYGMDSLKSGGFIGDILGNSIGLDKLGDQLTKLAQGLAGYAKEINGAEFNDENIEKSKKLAKFLATLNGAEGLKTGGLLGSLIGNSMPLSGFGSQLGSLAWGLKTYAEKIKDAPFDDAQTEKSRVLLTMLSQLASTSIPKSGGLLGKIFGGTDFSGFSAGLSQLASGLVKYVSTLRDAGFSAEDVTRSVYLTSVLSTLGRVSTELGDGQVLTSFGSSLVSFTEYLKTFVTNFTEAQTSLEGVNVQGFRDKTTQMVNAFGELLYAIEGLPDNIQVDFSGVISNLQQSITAIGEMGASLVTKFSESVSGVKSTVSTELSGLRSTIQASLNSFGATFSSSGAKMSTSLAAGIRSGAGAVKSTVGAVIGAALITANATKTKWTSTGSALSKAFASGISKNSNSVKSAAVKLSNAGASAAKGTSGKWESAGASISNGLARGIRAHRSGVINAAVSVAVSAYNAAKRALDSHSPSKLFAKLGRFIDEGFIVGMQAEQDDVAAQSRSLVDEMFKSSRTAIDELADLLNSDMITDPTITPVMDLSEIQNGANRLYSMLPDSERLSFNGNIDLANAASNSVSRDQRRKQESNDRMMGSLIDAINGLSALIGNTGNVYNVNGVTYDDGSNVSTAVRSLIRAAKVEGRA